jgi:hypothetical protein
MEVFKSKIKVKYISELGMYGLFGKSLTRRTLDDCVFYDKEVANKHKMDLDNQDFYFHHNTFLTN